MHHEELIKDFRDHGYTSSVNSDGSLVFDTTRDEYFDKVDKDIHSEHPIFFNDNQLNYTGNRSTVIMRFRCGKCRANLSGSVCPSCGTVFNTVSRKPHIQYPHEATS